MLLRKASLMRVIPRGHWLGVLRRYYYAGCVVSGCVLEGTRGVWCQCTIGARRARAMQSNDQHSSKSNIWQHVMF
jgi:hypothetical protein